MLKNTTMIITITINMDDNNIQIMKKGEENKTIPSKQPPIQYNEYSIKRKYYKKWDPEYHRKPSPILKFSKFGKIVKQEPLLVIH